MSPHSRDASKVQEHLLKAFSESAVRVANAWTEALEGAGLGPKTEARSLGADWIFPFRSPERDTDRAYPVRFQEMVEKATRDLPDLLKPDCDDGTIKRIKTKWLNAYEGLSTEFFGIPAPSETRRVLSQWKALSEQASDWGPPGGLIPDLASLHSIIDWLPGGSTGATKDLLRVWGEVYEKTWGGLFPVTAKPDSVRELEKSYRQTLDAQIAFLNSLAAFQEQMLKVASRAVDHVVDAVARLETKELSEDTYQFFYRTWMTQNEEAFQGVLSSDAFLKSLAETAKWGTEAKANIESLFTHGFSIINQLNRTELQSLTRSVENMTSRIDRLEEEVRFLRQQVTALAEDEDKNPDTADR